MHTTAAVAPASPRRRQSAVAESTTSTRRCAIAARLREDATCPAGGCRLARELDMAPDPDPNMQCPLEALAFRKPFCGLALASLHALRLRLEREAEFERELENYVAI